MTNIPAGYNLESFDDSEHLDDSFVLNALLGHNFFPNHKADSDELPPILGSASLTVSVAEKLDSLEENRGSAFPGYDAVAYRLTRFNGVPRLCSIPHPKAYARLALTISANWQNLRYVCENENSKIVPRRHRDGRLVTMDYEDRLSTSRRSPSASFGKRFVVRTDISNCYASIYSHAIPWAVVGIADAKRNRTDDAKWYNKLDRALQQTSRNETNGIAIGPGTSTIVSEAILARIDDKLRAHFTYHRFIDDYTAYCRSQEEAERFVLELAKQLANYKLSLNIGKTAIDALPAALATDWIIELQNSLPKQTPVRAIDAIDYLDNVVQMAENNPDGSVLKYGLKALANVMLAPDTEPDADAVRSVLAYALNLSFYHPVLIPILDRLLDKLRSLDGEFRSGHELQVIICEHVRHGRSDAISWGLFLANKYGVGVKECCCNQIIESRDCIPMLLLYLTGEEPQRNKVISCVESFDRTDLYEIDQYWLLLYQLFKEGTISDPYSRGSSKDTTFSIMKSESVDFVRPLG